MAVDRFTGKLIDSPLDNMPTLNGGICEICGTLIIDRCLVCGAPQCCPKCCAEATEELKNQGEKND